MSRVIVTGPGRSCSNWALEIARLSSAYSYAEGKDEETGHIYVEDRDVLLRPEIPDNYLAKCCTENVKVEDLLQKMEQYEDLKVLFCTRHPVDLCMAKIVRGQSSLDGGDGSVEVAPDATVDGAIAATKHANTIFTEINKSFPKRVYQVRLEDLIQSTVYETLCIATYLEVFCNEEMCLAYVFNRNQYHQKRYNQQKDMKQLLIHKRWDTAYDGFFKDRESDISRLKEELTPVLQSWRYHLDESNYSQYTMTVNVRYNFNE